LASPGVPSPVSGIRTPNLPLLPVWEKGARGDEGAHAHRNARASLPGTLPLTYKRCARLRRARGRDARAPGANLRCARPCRGGLVGKPRRAISRFRHQDAQPSPSPSLGEGGRGDEGAHAHGNSRASLPGTLPLRGARASGAHAGGTPAPPTRRKPQVRAPLQGQVCWQAPAYHLPFQASGRPTSPFSQFGRREQGGMRGKSAEKIAGCWQTGRRDTLHAVTDAVRHPATNACRCQL